MKIKNNATIEGTVTATGGTLSGLTEGGIVTVGAGGLLHSTAIGTILGLSGYSGHSGTSGYSGYLVNAVTGTGTSGKLAKFTGASTLGDSLLTESTGAVGIGTASPNANALLDVNGNINTSGSTLGSRTKTLTSGSPVNFATFAIASGAAYSGEIIYSVKAVKSGALQRLAGKVRFCATNESGVFALSIAEIGMNQTLAALVGTLAGTISISAATTTATLTATFTTSQASPDSFTLYYRFDSPDTGLVVTAL